MEQKARCFIAEYIRDHTLEIEAAKTLRTDLVALVLLPPILVAIITIAGWFWKGLVRLWLTTPQHVSKGLLRLYAVLSLPWGGWYGYQLIAHGPNWRYLPQTFWTLLAVPIGGPLLAILILWIRDGFRKQPLKMDDEYEAIPKPAPTQRSKSNLAIPKRPVATDYERETAKNPATAYLIVSILLFPRIWIIDVTSVSLFWVARLPKF